MAGKQLGLALAFLQSKPAAAARLLELQPPAEVAAFLADVPYAHTAGVFERMLPHYAAEICQHMPPETCVATLTPLNNRAIAAVLRNLPTKTKKQIIDLLPEKVKLTLRIIFTYADDSVGAWMIPNGLALPSNCKIGEALERVAGHGIENDHVLIPIVDREGLLQGEVTFHKLIRAANDMPITSIMQPAELRLLGRANLEAEVRNPGWQARDTLPVVDSAAKLVGILRHTDLRRGLAQGTRPADGPSDQSIIAQMGLAYSACFVALANTLFESDKR